MANYPAEKKIGEYADVGIEPTTFRVMADVLNH